MSAEMLPAALLKRKAVVYVRQSTQAQVQTNLESQRRQYDLVEVARRHGFVDIDVIDDDLGRSASGSVNRPGFERLVASVCAGDVGAVLCLDASRLSRNGRDWHHLLELCGLVQARVIDVEGVYDPCRPNDPWFGCCCCIVGNDLPPPPPTETEVELFDGENCCWCNCCCAAAYLAATAALRLACTFSLVLAS